MHQQRPRPTMRHARRRFAAFVRDERGQDLIEYALLTAGVAIVAAASWPIIADTIGTTYTALDTRTQGLWDPPPPGGGP
jgi:Flp pilus assembly pilin Flp